MTTLEKLTDQRNITTITFDMDDTLWDFQAAMERALEITLERLRVMAPGDAARKLTVQRMMEIRDEVASELGEGATTQEEIRYTAMVRTVEHVGFRARGAAEELYRLYWEARVAGARPYDDVAGVLEALRGRFRLGIISNGNNTPQMVGLDDVFDFTVFAHECGFPKPDPRIFEFAFAKSGDRPDSVDARGRFAAKRRAGREQLWHAQRVAEPRRRRQRDRDNAAPGDQEPHRVADPTASAMMFATSVKEPVSHAGE